MVSNSLTYFSNFLPQVKADVIALGTAIQWRNQAGKGSSRLSLPRTVGNTRIGKILYDLSSGFSG